MQRRRRMSAVVWVASAGLALLGGASCASDPSDVTPPAAAMAPPTGTGTAAADIDVPDGIVSAVPFQYRSDVSLGLVQLRLRNDTARDLHVRALRLVWAGMTTPAAERAVRLVAGGLLDLPVPLAPATCVGDGGAASMPDPQAARVDVALADGSHLEVPVIDVRGVAADLYLRDCERQHIDAQVALEWVDLHEAVVEGRPVTDGALRVIRRAAAGTVRVLDIDGTVTFTVAPRVRAVPGVPVVALAPGDEIAEAPVRFGEGRCDAHARSESSQPFVFRARIDLGDGVERAYVLVPPEDVRASMRARVDEACERRAPTG